jgi:hypothetical protein
MRDSQTTTKVTTLRGSEKSKMADLGFFPGGGGFYSGGGLPGGGGLNFGFEGGILNFGDGFSPPNFGFESSIPGLTFTEDALNIQAGFDFERDVLGQLPTNALDSSLPTFSQRDLPSSGDFGWKEFVAWLVAMGPSFIEAWRRGRGSTPKSAPQDAKSDDPKRRMQALARTLENQDRRSGSSFGGITPAQALGGAALVASLIAIVQTSQ